MKNSFLLLFIAFITNFGFAQAPPQGINYQAVVYSDNGENEPGLNVPGQVLRNKNIRVRFTIIQNTANGTEVYKESHTKTTDAFGMFSLVIGAGTSQGGSIFSNINWGVGLHFLKVEIDKRGGTNYVTMSNQQLLSVPYALYADKSTYSTTSGNGIVSVSDNGNGTLTFTYFDGSTYTTPVLTGLQGQQGIQGPAGQNGTNGVNGTNGANGQNGLSAYEIWLAEGNTGTESDFLNAIKGDQGLTGAQGIQGEPGQAGTNGSNGLSAYEIWLSQGNTGTEQDFLTSITGATGAQGIQGDAGQDGIDGTNGSNGLSSYQIWLSQGNTGTESDFLTAIIGATGSNGTDGKNTLTKTTTESAGANCTTGGVKLEYGLDANNNGTLDVSEINASLTKYVCNGATGTQGIQGLTGSQGIQGNQGNQGTNGTNGADGKNTLTKTTTESAGINCATSGVKLEYGLDANNNGTLDVSEINASLTKYVCNGAIGAQGLQGLTGAQGIQGIQGVAGSNGSNGTDGKNTLAKTTTETAGANCTTGGMKIEYGLDANNNGTLDVSEINASLTKYICNGAVGATGGQGLQGLTGSQGIQGIQGVAGSNGSNGADGKNTLTKTTTESAGVNCTTGGVKLEYGLDANNNGTLDISEINASLTKYVCNGTVGATGAQGIQGATGASLFSNMQVYSTSGTFSFTVPAGVTKIMVEVWGGGGGGGTNSTTGSYSYGGSGGGYGKEVINVVAGNSYTITVGAGGSGGASWANGGAGNSSSFGALVSATGGIGGWSPGGTGPYQIGAGGTSTASFNVSGQRTPTLYNTGGNGGNSYGGSGGIGATNGISSSPGIAPGGGGGGGCLSSGFTAGAQGGAGRVVVWY
jgi:hypothetical protein